MSNLRKKPGDEKKLLGETLLPSTSRGTFGGTSRKTISRSKSFCTHSSSTLRTLSDENEGTDPLEKEIENYEDEYSLYLLRVLQSKMVREDSEKGEEMKKCLVSLKKEYEDLLAENVALYDEFRKMETYGESCLKLEEYLKKASKYLQVLNETKFDEVLNKIGLILEANVNRLQLVGLNRKDIDEAFEKNIFGFDSDLYKLLQSMGEHAAENETLLPEMVERIKEIQTLHAENEKLKIRCTNIADQMRRKTIVSGYEKYFRMATEECRDILEILPAKRTAHLQADESLSQRTQEWGEPAGSSTPASTAVTAEKGH